MVAGGACKRNMILKSKDVCDRCKRSKMDKLTDKLTYERMNKLADKWREMTDTERTVITEFIALFVSDDSTREEYNKLIDSLTYINTNHKNMCKQIKLNTPCPYFINNRGDND